MDYLITVKPEYCDAYVSGKKSIEIRKRVPLDLCIGDRVFVCRGASNGMVQLCLKLDSFLVGSPKFLYAEYQKKLGIEYHEYLDYISGGEEVVFMRFSRIEVLRDGLVVQDFGIKKPPQWFARVMQYPGYEKYRVLKRYSIRF